MPLSPSLTLVPHDDPDSPVRALLSTRTALPPALPSVPRTVAADDAPALAYLARPVPPARVATMALGAGAPLVRGTAAESEGVRVLERTAERWVPSRRKAAAERCLVLTGVLPQAGRRRRGGPAPLARADFMFQGLYVHAGAHRVEIA